MTKGDIYIHHGMPPILLRNQVKEYSDNSLQRNFDLCIPYPKDNMGMKRAKL
jgi:hypothetical protein